MSGRTTTFYVTIIQYNYPINQAKTIDFLKNISITLINKINKEKRP
jgi:hypothetical protein